MTYKRALVVDDSRSAQMALKRLLQKHELVVELAASGEDCLEFLKDNLVDVIFMDHTMPGMDGLEAVAAIKRNPRTATIPVMMYTAKEGEVYVGQARALGAIDVLPKEVEPGVLFDMLLKLGLVTDRRGDAAELDEQPQPASIAERLDEPDPEADLHAIGTSVQALVSRVLEEQHLNLRADILSTNRAFAKQVAAEIQDKQRTQAEDQALTSTRFDQGPGWRWTLALAALTALLLVLFAQVRSQRDEALRDAADLASNVEQQRSVAESRRTSLQSTAETQRQRAGARYREALRGLQWAVNEGGHFDYQSRAFDGARIEQLRELLTHLATLRFRGTVRLEAHLGEFCLITDTTGNYQLPPPDLSVGACSVIGHPLDDSTFVGDRQSVAFANFLATSPLVNQSGIAVEVFALDRSGSTARHPVPSNVDTAGEWNRLARLNNRIHYTLIPASG